MSDKKYYWLKLKKDFFKRHDIQIIEAMPNGKDYILFYLKLLVESVDHDGNLRFSDTIPYNENMLSTITNTNVDIVRSAMKVFTELQMIEVLQDETIYMSEVEKLIGNETYWALQKRNQRKIGQCPTNVQLMSSMSNQEIDKEIDIDKEKEIDNITSSKDDSLPYGNCPHNQIMELFNTTCKSLPRIKEMTKARQDTMRVWWKSGISLEYLKEFFEMVEANDFLTGRTGKFQNCSFDWIIKPSNRQKILEGNYGSRKASNNDWGDW